jgi:hypothetical protein
MLKNLTLLLNNDRSHTLSRFSRIEAISMPRIFGRFVRSHPLESALISWERSTESDKQAMAWNLRSEHRVSPTRESSFLDRYFLNQPTGEELRTALDKHRKEVIGPAKLPEYVYARVNGNNLIAGHHEAKNLINKDVKLVNVLDLNGLLKPFQWYRSVKQKRHLDIDYVAVLKQSNFDVWLNKLLYQGSDQDIERVVGLCLEVLTSYHEMCGPYQPTWATTWDDFEEFTNYGSDGWVSIMGVGKWSPRWQIVLKYSVAEAGTLVRPTQIDGGYYAYHFASPPQAPLEKGGHPMSLLPLPPAKLLPEYIHKQIKYALEHWVNGGKLIGRTNSKPGDLRRLRTTHYDLCRRVYGARLLRWMPKPT